MKMLKAPLAVAISVATFGQMAFAEEARVTKLDQIVVTASRSESSVSDVSGTVQVISREEIFQQSQSGQKVADMLEQLVPGFGPSTETVSDRTQSLRGRRALILIDGISLADNRQINQHLNTVRPENIERIEVISGASAIYGGGATGGMINIITRKPEGDDIRFSSEAGVKISDSRLTTYTLNQTVSGRQGRFDYFVSGTYESRGGRYDSDGARINIDPSSGGSRSDSDTKDALVKLGYDLDEKQRLEATLQIFDDQMDTDYAVDASSLNRGTSDSAPSPVKGLQLDTQPYSKRNSIDLVYKNQDFYSHNLQLQTYYRERESRFYPYPNDLLKNNMLNVNQSTSTAKVFGFKLNLDTEITDELKIAYGLDYDVDKGEQRAQQFDRQEYNNSGGKVLIPEGDKYDYGPDVDTTTLGLYLQASYDLTEDVVLNAGIRHQRAEMDISDHIPTAEIWYLPVMASGTPYTVLEGDVRKYDTNLFNVGLVYQLNSSNELFANYSQGFEVPDASRLLRNAINESSPLAGRSPSVVGVNVSESNLDAIKTDSYELGWRGRFDSLFANVSLFYNESDQTINFTENRVDLLDQKRKVYGFEGALEFFIGDYWSVGGSYAFTEGRSYYKDIGKWLDLQAADVSPEKFTSFVTYDQGDMGVRLQATHFADYDKGKKFNSRRQHVTDLEVEGYTTVDLLVSYDLPIGSMKAGVTNLFNEDYQTVYSQWAESTYNGLSAHKGEGRAYTLSYRVEY